MYPLLGHLTFLGALMSMYVTADDAFLAFPRDRTNSPQSNQTDKAIKQLLGEQNVYSYVSPYDGVAFWLAPMNSDQQDKVKKFLGVDRIVKNDQVATTDDMAIPNDEDGLYYDDISKSNGLHKRDEQASDNGAGLYYDDFYEDPSNSPHLKKRDGTIARRANAVDELKLVSWKEGKNQQDLRDYAYDDVAGSDTWIYLVENGVNKDHPEVAPNAPETPYFYGPGAQKTEADDSPLGHGTCMASKAAGPNLGVASRAHLIVLKARPSAADNIWAFQQAKDDIIAKGRRGKAVVLFARGASYVFPGIENQTPWREIKPILQSMFPEDIVVVTSSGNFGELPMHRNVDAPPNIWSADDYPLIVVGAVDNQGKVALNPGKTTSFSQGGPLVTVWAPGKDVICATHNQDSNRLDTGTSAASAMAAGLVAYFLSLRQNPPFPVGGGNTAGNARNYLKNTARWTRPGGNDPAIWNGIDSLEGAADASPTQPAPTTPTATPTPQGPELPSCTNTKRTGEHDDYHIEINHMTGDVIADGGKNLAAQEKGCGIYNSWNWQWTKDDKTEAMVTFNQPWGLKGGCVERAFMTAALQPQIAKCEQKQG